MATRTQNVLGEKGRRIRELTVSKSNIGFVQYVQSVRPQYNMSAKMYIFQFQAVVQKRFEFPENSVELYAEKVATRGLCAIAQAESLRYKLIGGLAVRR